MDFGTIRDRMAAVDHYFGASRYLPDRRNAVLAYHSVGDPNSYGNVSIKRFRRDLAYLTSRYEVVDLPDVLMNPTSGEKQVALTFDDGHENFFTNAVPLLREFDLPATVFVVAKAIGDPDGLVNVTATMNEKQLQQVVADDRFAVGNHTLTHPRLSTVNDESRLREEIIGARRYLSDRLNAHINRFCYPSGEVSDTSLSLVRNSHDIAVTTVPETIGSQTDSHLIPRINAHRPESRVRWELTDLNTVLRSGLQRLRIANR